MEEPQVAFDPNGISLPEPEEAPVEDVKMEIPQLTPEAFMELAGQIYSRLSEDVRQAHTLLETFRMLKAEAKRARKRAARRKAAEFKMELKKAFEAQSV